MISVKVSGPKGIMVGAAAGRYSAGVHVHDYLWAGDDFLKSR
jgi:hypothetical protein